LYVGVRTGRAIKLIVGKNTALPLLAGRLKGKKWIVGAGITQVVGRWQEWYTDKFAESVYPSSVVRRRRPRGKVVAFEVAISATLPEKEY
jgi:hypothetical protein